MIIKFFTISLIINLILFLFYKFLSKLNNIYDIPDNKRKIHNKPIPLIGGLIFYINLLIFIALQSMIDFDSFIIFKSFNELSVFIIVITLFFFLGRIDDKKDLNSFLKLVVMTVLVIVSLLFDQDLLIENLAFSFVSEEIHLGKFSFFTTIICFLLFINAFNMLDGINSQAASYTLIIFLFFIFKDIYVSFLIFLTVCLAIYIYYNFKNLIFLGDSGSLILGYFISYICIKAYNQEFVSFVDEIYFLMCIPGYELLRLFIKRIYLGKNPFSADSNHLHHYIMNKTNFITAFILMQIIIVLPILSYLLLENFYLSIFLSLIIYFVFLFFFSKKI